MIVRAVLGSLLMLGAIQAGAQERKGLPDVSSTFKGLLALPVPLGNPLFSSVTETVGRLGAAAQWPLRKGRSQSFGIGLGGDATWFGIKERALAPVVTSGEVRRISLYGKVQFEQYTGPSTFVELMARAGSSTYYFDCTTCGSTSRSGLNLGLGMGFYIHASDNLAFGLTLGYERDASRFGASDLGLGSFPGRRQVNEARDQQNLVFGLGFSTRFRRSEDGGRGW